MSTFEMITGDLIGYWYLWTFAALFFGGIAFAFGADSQRKKESTIKCLMPLFLAESIILAIVAINVKEWVRIGASFHWVIYEHAEVVYFSVIAFVCILIGHLAGMIFARKKI